MNEYPRQAGELEGEGARRRIDPEGGHGSAGRFAGSRKRAKHRDDDIERGTLCLHERGTVGGDAGRAEIGERLPDLRHVDRLTGG